MTRNRKRFWDAIWPLKTGENTVQLFDAPNSPFNSKITQGSSYILLTGATLIGDSRVIKVDAQLQPTLDDLSRVFLVDGPAVLTPSGITEPHAAHADPGYI